MTDPASHHLIGKLLIAMPGMTDPRFRRALVYVCAHSSEGAMGLIVNRPIPDLALSALLKRLDIAHTPQMAAHPVHGGGPVEPGRGFVLHSPDYSAGEATLTVNSGFAMTATRDILEDIAKGTGPKRVLVTLGYSGWGPGQLDREMLDNGWLSATPGPGLVFSNDNESKWVRALHVLGIEPEMLSGTAGHA